MKKTLLFLLISFCTLSLTSCATFLNDNYKQINVFSNIKDATFTLNDTIYQNPATLKVKRDNKPLVFTLKSDSLNISKEYKVKYKLTPKFISGNLPMIFAAPFGVAVDFTNKKRFNYADIVQLNYFDNLPEYDQIKAKKNYRKENIRIIEEYAENQLKKERKLVMQRNILREKGDVVHNYIIPGFTSFFINPEGDSFSTAGLMKVGYGIDYFYKNSTFVNVDLIFKTNFIDPAISLMLSRKVFNPELSVTNNHRFNRFEVGYGLSLNYLFTDYTKNCFSCEVNDPPFTGALIEDQPKHSTEAYFSLGLKAQTAYQFNRRLYVGLFYQPSFVKFSNTNNNTKPDHFFGIDLRFKAKAAKK